MALPITSLPLPYSFIKDIISSGIYFLSEFIKSRPWNGNIDEIEFSAEIEKFNLLESQKNMLMGAIREYFKSVNTVNFEDVVGITKPLIITFCSQVDRLLEGGISPGEIVELLGEPGSGCTQLCLQIAVDCTIPLSFGGREDKALLVDCDGGSCTRRLNQIAKAAILHLQSISGGESSKEETGVTLTTEQLLSNIHITRCTDFTQLISLITNLNGQCEYGAVIIDSLATNFRHDFEDMRQRTNILAEVSNQLQSLCIKNPVSVLLVNQVRMDGKGNIQPCLGESWSHTADRRLLLRRCQGDVYSAQMMKGAKSGETVNFRISSSGIRDCPTQ